METMKEGKELPHAALTNDILAGCFEVMKELGPGFLEGVYQNALFIWSGKGYRVTKIFLT